MKKSLPLIFSLLLLPLAVAAYTLNRVTVHDPSVVWDPESKTYYIFGSHRAVAKTTDMMNWTEVKKGQFPDGTPVGVPWKLESNNNAYSKNAFTTPAITKVMKDGQVVNLPVFDAVKWSTRGNSNYQIESKGNFGWGTNLWAPDVIWNPVMKKWCMYMSVNGDNWYSSIVLLTADNIEGPYIYQSPIVISGFYSGDTYKSTDLEIVLGTQSALPERYATLNGTTNDWNVRWPNCIDPCVFYDEQGKLWMSYGSWFGGIFILELDENTGLRDYDVNYSLTGSGDGITVDPYFGKKIAGGYGVSGEGSYIEHIGNYYYLFISNGGFADDGGYQMRVFRSEKPDGPYADARGLKAVFTSRVDNFGAGKNVDTRGENIFGAYGDWGKQTVGRYSERSQGHNSIIAAEDGRTYLVYHTRFQDSKLIWGWDNGHQVRVHQVFQNKDGWLVAAPFEYTGEQVKSADIATTQQIAKDRIPGTYQLLIHEYKLDHTKKELNRPEEIKLNANGSISKDGDDEAGTWSIEEGTSYINITLGKNYSGVMIEQTLEPSEEKTVAFTAVTKSGVTIWGYQTEQTTGIESIKAATEYGKDYLFDLQGHRVATPQKKGIYIQNGKKFVVK